MNTPAKLLIVTALAAAVAGVVVMKNDTPPTQPDSARAIAAGTARANAKSGQDVSAHSPAIPKLLDLGADKCIPCKLMAPILENLKEEYAGRMEVEFIDVWKNPEAGTKYGVEMIPTQIFLDPTGKELFRHTGFLGKEDILAKWKELGIDIGEVAATTPIIREAPLAADVRPQDTVCSLCDGDVDPGTRTIVRGQKEQRILCGPHCYFIYLSSVVGADPQREDQKVRVTDWSSGDVIAGTSAFYLYGMDDEGRPTIKAFGSSEAAEAERKASAGVVLGWDVLRAKEMAARCGFCDRAVYPEDACKVTVEGTTHAYGCCTHCAMGVASRTGKDIEVEAYDGLTGEPIHIKTLDGQIASLEPATAIAWFGQKKNAEGKWASAGCFKQGFFINQENLRKWLDTKPTMTGREITIAKALADKMKLTPEQIAKACKLGECQ